MCVLARGSSQQRRVSDCGHALNGSALLQRLNVYVMSIVVRTYVEESSTKIRFPFNEKKNADIKNFLRGMEAIWGNSWSPNWNDGPFCWEVFHLQDDYKGRKLFYLPEFLSSPRDRFQLENMIGTIGLQITYPPSIGSRLYNLSLIHI